MKCVAIDLVGHPLRLNVQNDNALYNAGSVICIVLKRRSLVALGHNKKHINENDCRSTKN
jgi:hypothetical protein